MSQYVSDTHALIWHLTDDERLPPTCRNLFVGADRCDAQIWIPAIVIVEVIYLVEKARVPQGLVERMLSAIDSPRSGYSLAALDGKVARTLMQIPRDSSPDMPDRIIAATALAIGAPLLTKDAKLQNVPGVTTIWA